MPTCIEAVCFEGIVQQVNIVLSNLTTFGKLREASLAQYMLMTCKLDLF